MVKTRVYQDMGHLKRWLKISERLINVSQGGLGR